MLIRDRWIKMVGYFGSCMCLSHVWSKIDCKRAFDFFVDFIKNDRVRKMKFHDFMTQNLLSQNNRMSHLSHNCGHEVMKWKRRLPHSWHAIRMEVKAGTL